MTTVFVINSEFEIGSSGRIIKINFFSSTSSDRKGSVGSLLLWCQNSQ
jgi:hypothetical protein